MELKTIITELIEDIITEINQPEQQEKIKSKILDPFIIYLIKQLYPYLVSTCIIILLMLLCIISVLIILIRKM
jgi:hypothetical protein